MLDMKVVSERKEREKGCVAAKKVRKCVRVCDVVWCDCDEWEYESLLCVCLGFKMQTRTSTGLAELRF